MPNLTLLTQNGSKEHGRYEYFLPDSWKAQKRKEFSRFFDKNKKLGILHVMLFEFPGTEQINPLNQLSELLASGKFNYSPANIKTYTKKNKKWTEIVCVDLNEAFWKLWVIVQKNKLMFAAYHCPLKYKNQEIQAVNDMMESMQIKKRPSSCR